MALAISLPRDSVARCSRIQVSRSATSGALSSWRTASTLLGTPAVDRPLDLKQSIDPANHLQRQRRDHWRLLALSLATRVLGQVCHDEERTPGVDPTGCFQDWSGLAAGLVELAIAAVGIGLEDSAVVGQMPLGMLAGPIARVIEHCRWRRRPAERLVVANVDPYAAGVGLAFGKDGDWGVVPMQSLGAQNVRLEALVQRRQCRRAAADLVGQGRQTDRHALLGIALRLPVERLMLAKLLEQNHRQQAWPCPAAGDDVERRRRLADLLAITAGELLADVLDHLPGFGDDLQRLGDVLAQACDSRPPPQQAQAVGPGTITRSRGRWSGKGLRDGRLRVNDATFVVLAAAISAASSSSVAVASSSSSCNSS